MSHKVSKSDCADSNKLLTSLSVLSSEINKALEFVSVVRNPQFIISLTKAIVFELIYYTNGHF